MLDLVQSVPGLKIIWRFLKTFLDCPPEDLLKARKFPNGKYQRENGCTVRLYSQVMTIKKNAISLNKTV